MEGLLFGWLEIHAALTNTGITHPARPNLCAEHLPLMTHTHTLKQSHDWKGYGWICLERFHPNTFVIKKKKKKNHSQTHYCSRRRGGWGNRREGVMSTYVFDNTNAHQKAALSCVWLSGGSGVPVSSHQPPPFALLTDYYPGNPLAYAWETAMCETAKLTAPRVPYWIFVCDECA